MSDSKYVFVITAYAQFGREFEITPTDLTEVVRLSPEEGLYDLNEQFEVSHRSVTVEDINAKAFRQIAVHSISPEINPADHDAVVISLYYGVTFEMLNVALRYCAKHPERCGKRVRDQEPGLTNYVRQELAREGKNF